MKYGAAKGKYETAMDCIAVLDAKDSILMTAVERKRLSQAKNVQRELVRRASHMFWEFGSGGHDIPISESDGEEWVSPVPSPSIGRSNASTAVEVPPLVLSGPNETIGGLTVPVTRAMSVYLVQSTSTGTVRQEVDPVRMQVKMPIKSPVDETQEKPSSPTKAKRKRKGARDNIDEYATVSVEHAGVNSEEEKEGSRKRLKGSESVAYIAKSPTIPPCDRCAHKGTSCYAQVKKDRRVRTCVVCRHEKQKCTWERIAAKKNEPMDESSGEKTGKQTKDSSTGQLASDLQLEKQAIPHRSPSTITRIKSLKG